MSLEEELLANFNRRELANLLGLRKADLESPFPTKKLARAVALKWLWGKQGGSL